MNVYLELCGLSILDNISSIEWQQSTEFPDCHSD